MELDDINYWLIANQAGLLLGAVVAAAIIAVLLSARWLGRRACERDPEGRSWRSVIGRALARTALAFMIVAGADAFATYTSLPPHLERVIDIAFIVGFALQ